MALSSRRSAKRSIITVAVGLLTVGFLASCGANKAAADPTTQPPSPSGETRPGCGTYCQSAGPVRAAGGPVRTRSRLSPAAPSPSTRMAICR